MCFGGSPKPQEIKAPVVVAPPTPATPAAAPPTPATATATATATTPVETESSVADKKRKQIASYQSGFASTIKTSPQGATGAVNLLAPAATEGKKRKLGE